MSLEPQDIPAGSRCPNCGAKPTDETRIEHRLSNLGYKHDDILLECSECGTEWNHGMAQGNPPEEMYEDLRCECGVFMRVHGITARGVTATNPFDEVYLRLLLKCPNCQHTKRVDRETDGTFSTLVGFPMTTGELDIEAAREDPGVAWGWDPDLPKYNR